MNENELMHYGVLGMKWGVRRYQNRDGSLTSAGKKRYDRDIRENNAKKKDNRINIDGPDPHRWAKEDTKRRKEVVDSTSNAVKQARQIVDKLPKKHKSMDLSKMSDKELRDRINRTNLENQYLIMFAPETVSKGRKYVKTTLDVAGTTLAIGSSALGIALAIKELKG